MVSQKVVNYLQKGKKKGFSYQRLKQELLKSGFKEKTVNDAVNYLKQQKASGIKKKISQKKVSQKKEEKKKPSSKKSIEKEFEEVTKKQKPKTSAKKVQDKKEGKKLEKEKKKFQDKKEEKRVSKGDLKKFPKPRRAGLVLLLSIITFGIYGIIWLVKTTKELRANTKTAPKPSTLWLLLIPIVNAIVMIIYFWKYSSAVNELTGFSKGGLFALWIFLGPVAQVVTQLQLNKLSESK